MRVEHIGDATLYLGDCRDVLPTLSPVDLVVTSPPYDNLREYGEGFQPLDCLPVISALAANIKPGGVIMWNVADATINGSETGTSFRQALHAMSCGLNLHDTMIYLKEKISFPGNKRYHSAFEYMFVLSSGTPKTFNAIKDRPNKWAGSTVHGTQRQANGDTISIHGRGKLIADYGARFNYWLIHNGHHKSLHPATMPMDMAKDHILTWSNPGETVLDPFAGSGTSGVAALKAGRKFVGIELDERYFKTACERIAAATVQPSMFEAA